MQNVDGKVVIITGASSGIGAETARVLAANGAKVVLSARRTHAPSRSPRSWGPTVRHISPRT